jgi:hypothetical protein
VTGQRILAVFLTVCLFLLVIFGFGALFAIGHQRGLGMGVGVGFCALMVFGFLREQRRSR